MGIGLRDFSRWYCRHTGIWKWREKHPDANAKALGHETEGKAGSKGLATAAIRVEIQRRAAPEEATPPEADEQPELPTEPSPSP